MPSAASGAEARAARIIYAAIRALRSGEQDAVEKAAQAIVAYQSADSLHSAELRDIASSLYDALKRLLAKVECGTALDCGLCDAARAALAKAETRS